MANNHDTKSIPLALVSLIACVILFFYLLGTSFGLSGYFQLIVFGFSFLFFAGVIFFGNALQIFMRPITQSKK
jgi:hypothetical protein